MLESLFYSLTDALIATDNKGVTILFNQAAEDLTNLKAGNVLGRSLYEAFPENRFLASIEKKVSKSGRSHCLYDEVLLRSPGEPVPVSVSAFPVLREDGGIGFLIRDISILRRLEEEAKTSDQLESFRTLALGLAHEIRNPLAGIRGSSQLLKGELADEEGASLREYTGVIIREVDRLDRLVEQFLNFAGPVRLDCLPLNIHSLLDEMLYLQQPVADNAGIRLTRRYDPSLPLVLGDWGRLLQVFINVLKNGIEAMPSGGEIVISTAMPPEFVYSSMRVDNIKRRMIAVKIIDQGVGMPPERQREAFNPFFTTKPRGVGLGLALSLKIIEEHHGTMRIESEPGVGTAVFVYIPIAG